MASCQTNQKDMPMNKGKGGKKPPAKGKGQKAPPFKKKGAK